MAEPFIGQILMFAGNFAPRGWAFCDGQLLAINSNQALFSILGTTYGGDGRTTFGLPDLRGRVSMHPGNGPGLSERRLGERGGLEAVTLTTQELPSHTHQTLVSDRVGDDESPVNTVPAVADATAYVAGAANSAGALTAASGGSQGHTNVQPFTCVNYIIALVGIFPSRG